MNQRIKVELSIPVPADSIIIKKVEYDRLLALEDKGQFENAAWLKEKTRINTLEKLKELILYPYREELDVRNGGFVFYPRDKGEPFAILKLPMEQWLENNFSRIYKGKT